MSAGENVEFFRRARRGAFAGKCVSAAGSELTVARRRRKESLPPLAMLQTRSAASRGPRPVGPALCWKLVQATGGHAAVRFLKLLSTAEPSSSYSPSLRCPRANTAARPIWRTPAGRTSDGGLGLSSPGVFGAIRRRALERKYVRWILQPARPPKVWLAHPQQLPHVADGYRTQRTATHHANDAHSLAAAAETRAAPYK